MQVVLILHDIRSSHNVGSIFRTSDGVGKVGKIYLSGYTPAPTDQFGRVNKEIAKTALGAEKTLPWEKVESIFELIKNLKAENWKLIALEQAANSTEYKNINLKSGEGAAVIVGNEVGGVDPEILKLCDVVAEIPMRGEKESLNVAVATGIALYRWLDR